MLFFLPMYLLFLPFKGAYYVIKHNPSNINTEFPLILMNYHIKAIEAVGAGGEAKTEISNSVCFGSLPFPNVNLLLCVSGCVICVYMMCICVSVCICISDTISVNREKKTSQRLEISFDQQYTLQNTTFM